MTRSAEGHYNCVQAGVAELADAWDLKSQVRKAVRVRFPPPAFKILGNSDGLDEQVLARNAASRATLVNL